MARATTSRKVELMTKGNIIRLRPFIVLVLSVMTVINNNRRSLTFKSLVTEESNRFFGYLPVGTRQEGLQPGSTNRFREGNETVYMVLTGSGGDIMNVFTVSNPSGDAKEAFIIRGRIKNCEYPGFPRSSLEDVLLGHCFL